MTRTDVALVVAAQDSGERDELRPQRIVPPESRNGGRSVLNRVVAASNAACTVAGTAAPASMFSAAAMY
jgi:hypothetical protein